MIVLNSTSSLDGNAATATVSHIINAGGARILIVGISWRAAVTVSSVTHNGQAMTLIGSSNTTNAHAELWDRLLPAVGTFDVVVTFSGATPWIVGALTLNNVSQTAPLGTFAGATGATNTPTVAVSGRVNDIIVDTVAQRQSILTVGAGQTQRWNITHDESGLTQDITGGGSTEPGAASVTMAWSSGNTLDWAIGGVAIHPGPVVMITDGDI